MKVIWTLFNQNKFLNLLNLVASSVFFFLLVVLILNINQTSIETSAVHNFKDKNLYQISDMLYDEKEYEFFSKENSSEILNDFSNHLANSQEFDYYNAIWQPISVSNFKGETIFDAYYETGNNQPPYKLNNVSYRTIKSMQFNSVVFDLNNIIISSGRSFERSEYIYNEKDSSIPIILGSEFTSHYKLGDIIEIDYYQKHFKGKVIGFLNSLQKVVTVNNPEILLDRYIILPAMHFNELPPRSLFRKALLLSKSNGTIITELSPLEIRKSMDVIASKTGFSDFQVIGANNLATNTLVKMTETNRTTLYITTFVLLILTLFLFIFTISLKVGKNTNTFLVLLISGANLKHIRKFVSYEIIIVNLFAGIGPIIVLLVLINNSYFLIINYFSIVVIFTLILMILIGRFIRITFDKIDLVQKLKG